MEITFQNKRSDLDAYQDYVLKQTQEGKQLGKRAFAYRQLRVILFISLISALAWGTLSSLGARNSLLTSGLIFVSLLIFSEGFLFLLAGFRPFYYFGKEALLIQARSLTKEDIAIFQLPKMLKIDIDWLEVRSSASLHQWRWGLVDDIRRTPDFIFLQVGKCHVYHIPKRDFQSESDFSQFGNQLVELHSKYKDQSVLDQAK